MEGRGAVAREGTLREVAAYVGNLVGGAAGEGTLGEGAALKLVALVNMSKRA